jgi:hypothetical protein
MAKDFNIHDNYVLLDLFPAHVTLEGVVLGEALRAGVTDSHFYLFDDTLEGPDVVRTEDLVSFEGTNKTGYTVVTAENTYYIVRSANCGCGSRLRGIHPFDGIPRSA